MEIRDKVLEPYHIQADGSQWTVFKSQVVKEENMGEANRIGTRELNKILKNGFCGYDWMIDNIIDHQSCYEREVTAE